jgi:ribosomal protein S18 acetylase RimI-like enzyme
MRVPYPSWGEALLVHQPTGGPSTGSGQALWLQRGDLILVAAEAAEVRGFIDQEYQPDQNMAWILHLIVSPAYRRQGIGSALLGRAMQAARQQGMAHVMTVVQSKNHPAISFLQHHGFTFCGYNERYYRNLDIALYFVRGL